MIQAQELRIGNLVSIISEEPEYLRIEGVKTYDYNSDETQVRLYTIDEWLDISSVAPIPLTEEILLKCEGYFKNEFGVGIMYEPDYGNAFYLMKDGSIQDCHYDTPISNYRHIKYLHQLQNLYYIKTNTELKITL
jgi:hypothetical protein